MRLSVAFLAALSPFLFACDKKTPAPLVESMVVGELARPDSVLRVCFGDDSGSAIVFSDLLTAEETGDVSGVELHLWIDTTGNWRGTSRVATGELGPPTSLLLTDRVTGGDSIRFGFLTGLSDTAFFVGTASCESLTGRWTLYGTVVQESKTFHRAR